MNLAMDGVYCMGKKQIVIRKFLYEYGKEMGYDGSSFPNKILGMVSSLKRKGVAIEETVGIKKFGGRWFSIDQTKFVNWLKGNVKPGPNYGLKSIPGDMKPIAFIESATGIYNLRAFLAFLEPEVVNFYKVRNAAKKVENKHGDARAEIGAFIKNDIWVVEFPKFGVYLRENEPKIWTEYQRILIGNQSKQHE